MAAMHIVDQLDNLRRLKNSSIVHEWECSARVVTPETAEKLVGADLYIHERPSKPSFFGGRITGFRIPEEEGAAKEVVFRFQATNDHRDIKTSRAGWVNESKIVW